MSYREKYLKYKTKYLNLQKGGEFDIETVKNTRLKKEISRLLENNNTLDLTYNYTEHKVKGEDGPRDVYRIHIEIPSKKIKISIIGISRYPFVQKLILTLDLMSYYTDKWSPMTKMDTFIEDAIKNDIEKYQLKIPIYTTVILSSDGDFKRDHVFISQSDKITDFIEKIFIRFKLDKGKHFINQINWEDDSIFYFFKNNENKKIVDILPKDKLPRFKVKLSTVLPRDFLIEKIKDEYVGPRFIIDENKNTISKSKIVSTFETIAGLGTIADNMYLNKDYIETNLFDIFRTTEVKLRFNDNGLNPVVFYIEPYLNEFAEKLKAIHYFDTIENIPEYLLNIVTRHIEEEDNFNFTLIILLFGDREHGRNMYPDFKLNEDIMKVYDEYINNTSNIIKLN